MPLVVVGWSSYRISRATLQQEASGYTEELVEEYAQYVDRLCADVEGLMGTILGAEEIRRVIEAREPPRDDYDQLATQAKLGAVLGSYTRLEGLVSIGIFTASGAYYHVGDTFGAELVREDVRDAIFARAAAENRQVVWTGIEDNINASSRHQQVLTAVRALQGPARRRGADAGAPAHQLRPREPAQAVRARCAGRRRLPHDHRS